MRVVLVADVIGVELVKHIWTKCWPNRMSKFRPQVRFGTASGRTRNVWQLPCRKINVRAFLLCVDFCVRILISVCFFLAGPAKKRTKKGGKGVTGMTSGEEGSDGEGLTTDEHETHETRPRPRRSGLRAQPAEPQSDVDQPMDQDEPAPVPVTPKARPRPKPRAVYKAKPSTNAPPASDAHGSSPQRSPVAGSSSQPEVNGFETPKASRKRARHDDEDARSTTLDRENIADETEDPADMLTPPNNDIQFRRKRVRH